MPIFSLGKTLLRNSSKTQTPICTFHFSLSIICVMREGVFPDPSTSVAINLHSEK